MRASLRAVRGYIRIEHPRFVRAETAIFTSKLVSDCMTHRCRVVSEHDREMLDACCRYGADVDVGERDAILQHNDEIAALLRDGAASAPWFDGDETKDADFPSGRYVRTATRDGGCIFLAHDQRGCAIHRASLAGGWDLHGVKPHVCRLYPLSYESDAIVMSDDYPDYSCAHDPSAPTVYQVSRVTLAAIFGNELVIALDRAEHIVLGPRSQLRVVVDAG